jgi:hypothetical protein
MLRGVVMHRMGTCSEPLSKASGIASITKRHDVKEYANMG